MGCLSLSNTEYCLLGGRGELSSPCPIFAKSLMADLIVDDALETLFAEFTRSGVRELHFRRDRLEVYLSNDSASATISRASKPAAPTTMAATPPSAGAPASGDRIAMLPENAMVVRAPNLGTFYRAPKPGAEVYVEVGSIVAIGAELCLIEVMKLFTTVQSDTEGRVLAVFPEDGSMVEAGQPLFAIVSE